MTELEKAREGLKVIILMNVEVNAVGDIVLKEDGLDRICFYLRHHTEFGLEEGYKAMAKENKDFAKMTLELQRRVVLKR